MLGLLLVPYMTSGTLISLVTVAPPVVRTNFPGNVLSLFIMVLLHVLFYFRRVFADQFTFLAENNFTFVAMTLLNMPSQSKFGESLIALCALFLYISIF